MSNDYLQNLFGLDDRVIVVIGGTGVLGGALANGLAGAGATVVVSGRSEERGQQRVDEITKAGGVASFCSVDATSRESIQQLCDYAVKTYGKVDGLVNCAGVNSATPYLEIDEADFHRVVSTNLESTHVACQVFGKQMMQDGSGAILNIGSVTSFMPLSRVFIYSATKAAVLNLTKNIAREFAPHNVRVNCLCPGFFPAEQNRKILDKKRIEDIMRHTPMNRFGNPEELVGAAILLLASKAGSFISGEEIYVDGGFTSMTI